MASDRISLLQRLRGYAVTWYNGDTLPERYFLEAGAGLTAEDDPVNLRTVWKASATALVTAANVVAALAGVSKFTLLNGVTVATDVCTTANATPVTLSNLSLPMSSGHAITVLIIAEGLDTTPTFWGATKMIRMVNNAGSLVQKSNDDVGTAVDDIGIGGVAPALVSNTLTWAFTGKAATTITSRFLMIALSL